MFEKEKGEKASLEKETSGGTGSSLEKEPPRDTIPRDLEKGDAKGKGRGKGFQGHCYNCGEFGHSANNCRWSKEVNEEAGEEEGDPPSTSSSGAS